MSNPFDFDDPPAEPSRRRDDRPRQRSRDDEERPRRRSRDDDYDDEFEDRRRRREEEVDREWMERRRRADADREYERRIRQRRQEHVPKKLPASVAGAAVGWLIFGILELLVGLIAAVMTILAVIGSARMANRAAAQDAIIQLGVTGAVLIAMGTIFLVFATGVLRSRASDVIGQAITSWVVAGLFLVAAVVNLDRIAEINRRGFAAQDARTLLIVATLFALLLAGLLGGCGIAALVGRGDYQRWIAKGRRRDTSSSNRSSDSMTGDDFASSFG